MATKFVRETIEERAKGAHHASDNDPRKRGPSLRQRLIIIYFGIGVFTIVMFAAIVTGVMPVDGWGPAKDGTAVVVEKTRRADRPGDRSRILTLKVTATDGPPGQEWTAQVATDPESWNRVEVDDRLDVTYQVNRSGTAVRVLEIFPAAAPSNAND